MSENLRDILSGYPYNSNESKRDANDEFVEHLYNLIKDNEIDQLKNLIENNYYEDLPRYKFDFIFKDEEVL